MTLRTTAIIAGVLGLLMLIAGLFANDARPDREVVTSRTVDTPVVVLGPEIVAIEGLERISVNAKGSIEAHTARVVDAEGWLRHYSATYVTGYAGWEDLETRTASRIVVPSPNPSPSASASPLPTAAAETAAASPSPSPSATPNAAASEDVMAADYGSADVWRSSWRGSDRISLAVGAIAPGEVLVVYAADGSNLDTVQFTAVREVNDGWIDPLIWIGGVLAGLGVIAALSGLIDTRPAQERAESWLRTRSRAGAEGSVRPGSRRERRLAGSSLPESVLDEPQSFGPPEVESLEVSEASDVNAVKEPTEADAESPAKPTKKKGGVS